MNSPTFVAITGLTFLTACGGATTTAGSLSFNELIDNYVDLVDSSYEADYTQDEDLRTNGSAEYQGFFTVGENNTGDDDAHATYIAVGEANVAVDFGSGDVSGSAYNFYEIDIATVDFDDENQDVGDFVASAISGSLNVSTDGTSISGSLTHLDGEEASYDLVVNDVEFRGNDAEYLIVSSDGTSSAAGRGYIDTFGIFFGVDTAANN